MPDPHEPESAIAAVLGRVLDEAMKKVAVDDRLEAIGFILGWATSWGYAELLALSRASVAAGGGPLDARGIMAQIHADMLVRAESEGRARGLEPPTA